VHGAIITQAVSVNTNCPLYHVHCWTIVLAFLLKISLMRWFQPENAPKAFGGRDPPRLDGGA